MQIVRSMHGRTKWPFKVMRIGQTVLVKDEGKWPTARVLATYYGKKNGRCYQTRKSPSGLRIKRVS